MSFECVCVRTFSKLSYWNYHLALKIIIIFFSGISLCPSVTICRASVYLSFSHSAFYLTKHLKHTLSIIRLLFTTFRGVNDDNPTRLYDSPKCVCFLLLLLLLPESRWRAMLFLRYTDMILLLKINERINYLQRFFYDTRKHHPDRCVLRCIASKYIIHHRVFIRKQLILSLKQNDIVAFLF